MIISQYMLNLYQFQYNQLKGIQQINQLDMLKVILLLFRLSYEYSYSLFKNKLNFSIFLQFASYKCRQAHGLFLAEYGCIDLFLKLLFYNDRGVRNQAVQGLCHFIEQSQKNLLYLCQHGLVQKLSQVENKITNKAVLLMLVSSIPEKQFQPDLIPIFSKFILKHPYKDEDQLVKYLICAAWGLENIIANGFYDIILSVNGILQVLIQFLQSDHMLLVNPAIRIISYISSGNMRQRQELLDIGCQKYFLNLLQRWKHIPDMISFIPICLQRFFSENNSQQIQIIMKEIDLIKQIFKLIQDKDQNLKEFQKQSIIAFSFALFRSDEDEILILLHLGILKLFCKRIQFQFDEEEASAIVLAFEYLLNRNIQSTKNWIYKIINSKQNWLQLFLECTSENVKQLHNLSFVKLYVWQYNQNQQLQQQDINYNEQQFEEENQ